MVFYRGKMKMNPRIAMVIILVILLAVLISLLAVPSAPAHAQEPYPTPTPLPQVIATQQAAADANQQVNDLQAQRAQTEAKLSEINRNIEAQIAAATQAAADARAAAATQNAVESGAAIGRLEGAISQLRDSYAGKDAIINDLQLRNEQQATAVISSSVEINQLRYDLQIEKSAHQTAQAAYTALQNQQAQDSKTSTIGNIVAAFEFIVVLVLLFAFGAFVVTRRRNGVTITTATAEVIEPRDDNRAEKTEMDG